MTTTMAAWSWNVCELHPALYYKGLLDGPRRGESDLGTAPASAKSLETDGDGDVGDSARTYRANEVVIATNGYTGESRRN